MNERRARYWLTNLAVQKKVAVTREYIGKINREDIKYLRKASHSTETIDVLKRLSREAGGVGVQTGGSGLRRERDDARQRNQSWLRQPGHARATRSHPSRATSQHPRWRSPSRRHLLRARFAKEARNDFTVGNDEVVNYPRLPQGGPWGAGPQVPDEPPFGIDIESCRTLRHSCRDRSRCRHSLRRN